MVSIITPVLNGAKFIEKNIASVMALKIPYEHIIVDGGSNDGTLNIVAKYQHLKLLHQEEKTGMYGAIDQGFNQAKGKYLGYVNADDIIIDEGFERMYKEISTGGYDLVYSDGILDFSLENRKSRFSGKHFGKHLLKNGFMPFLQPCSIYTKRIYKNVGGLNYNKFRIMGDRDLFQRIAQSDQSKIKYIKVDSAIFLKHGNSLGDQNNERYLEERKQCYTNDNLFNRAIFRCSSIFSKIKNGRIEKLQQKGSNQSQ